MEDMFYWGCATAAAQIEGGYNQDGKGESIWDYFSNCTNKIKDGKTNQVANDSYNKYKDDIALLKELGCNAYRFSISWPRIIPDGFGAINKKGLEYYDKLIDECIKNNIEPFVTLYHWDMPINIYKENGWLNKNIIDWFTNYCEIVVSHFKDKVKHWIVINEPQCVLGDMGGTNPDYSYSTKEKLQMIHNLLICNAKGVQIIHKYGGEAGCAFVGYMFAPKDDNNLNEINEAKRQLMRVDEGNVWQLAIYSDPMLKGKYPEAYFKVHKPEDLPLISKEDEELFQNNTCDFIGHNVYYAHTVSFKDNETVIDDNIDPYVTLMNWPVLNKSLYWAARLMCEIYNKPFYITENGISVYDEDDNIRVSYIINYIDGLLKAKNEGYDVRGYFHWSLFDNFEWYQGYTQKFGLTRIDRTKKDSFYKYKEIIQSNKF